jgi:RimJ/RimL family protein N-acetyltransferase
MNIQTSLFTGDQIVLAPIDHEKDAEVEAKWTQNPEYLRMLDTKPALPRSAAQIKKGYEKLEKDAEESKNFFYFTIRAKPAEANDPGRLIGFIQLYWIEWNHGTGMVKLGLGDPEDRGKGYGSEALRLILRFVFAELNLFRLAAVIPEYNQPALRLFKKAGFIEEVCRRKALQRAGKVWDLLHLGILREEWEEGMKRGA